MRKNYTRERRRNEEVKTQMGEVSRKETYGEVKDRNWEVEKKQVKYQVIWQKNGRGMREKCCVFSYPYIFLDPLPPTTLSLHSLLVPSHFAPALPCHLPSHSPLLLFIHFLFPSSSLLILFPSFCIRFTSFQSPFPFFFPLFLTILLPSSSLRPFLFSSQYLPFPAATTTSTILQS